MKIKSLVLLIAITQIFNLLINSDAVAQVQAQMPPRINRADQVVVYPLPSNFTVVDAGMSAQLSWSMPQQTVSHLATPTASKKYYSKTENHQAHYDLNQEIHGAIINHAIGSKSLDYRQLLYDNGSFINSPGTGPNATDQSILQNTSLGMVTHGAGVQFYEGNRVADEFVVDEDWVVESFTFYTYQTGSGRVSTIKEAYIQIWDGNPTTNGQIIWGNLNENRIATTAWTNSYRMSETSSNTTRPIMSVTCATPNLMLSPGTYWIDFSFDGLLESGPWAVPITINGQTTTGNALQYSLAYGWQNFIDNGTNTPQGVPYVIQGVKGSGSIVNGPVIGYRILRDGAEIATVSSEVFNYKDEPLNPGSYTYSLCAIYGDPYSGESSPLVTNIEIVQPSTFPFEEDWKTQDFETNQWSFLPFQANWFVTPDYGKPAPAAHFWWFPGLGNYSVSMISNFIDATTAEQNVTLQFDVLLNSFTPTGLEKLKVSIWNGYSWVLLATLSNNSSFYWETQSYDVTPYALGKLTRLKFEAKGVNSTNIHNWVIDNIKLFEGLSSLHPEISINPNNLEFWLPMGGAQTQDIIIANSGQDPLFWDAAIQYIEPATSQQYPNPTDKSVKRPLTPNMTLNGSLKDTTATSTVLHYDNGFINAVGLNNGGYYYASVRFPSSITTLYSGYTMESVEVYINDVPLNSKLYIWGKGSSSAPGYVLHEQPFTPLANSWNTITLTRPIVLSTQDIWVGYSTTHVYNKPPSGCDDGPQVPDGCWFSTNGTQWMHLYDLGLSYNWNIRALVKGSDFNWLSISNAGGVIASGGSQSITVSTQTSGLGAGSYHANIVIPSNDPNSPLSFVPISLNVGVGVPENINQQYGINVFPVPAGDEFTVELSDMNGVLRIINSYGQIVFCENIKNSNRIRINTRSLKSGIYSLLFQNNSMDKNYSRTIIISH